MNEQNDKRVLLSLRDVDVKFNVRGRILTAIRNVSLDIYENESLAIVGESGSGKSVLTKTFAGMLDSNGFIPNGTIIFSDGAKCDMPRVTDDIAFKAKYQRVFNLPEGKAYVSNVLEFAKDKDGYHPTQKPVGLIRQLIATYSNPGDTILDNTIGSGTTAVAALREKRHFIGFELNRDYYDIALRRIKLEQQQQTLF